ncbi:MAG: flagellar hook-length control protein FliK [Cognatishimia sp.]|nr:flagellar hook-length control protein FliK [Cognatishimia sp.]
MNMTMNPLVALVGGGAAQLGGMPMQLDGMKFAQLIQGQTVQSMVAQPLLAPHNMSQLAAKAGSVVTTLVALETSSDLDISEITLEDLAAFFEDALDLGANMSGEDGDLASLLQTLSDLQEMMRDLIDLLPDLLEEFAPESLILNDLDTLNFAAIIEVSMFVQDTVSNPQLMAAQSRLLNQMSAQTANVDTRPLPALSLVSDIDGIAVPEQQLKETLTLTPPGATVFRTIAISVIQSQRASVQSVDFEASEAPLALASRAETPLFEQLEQSQAPQQAQRPEAQISTKFANVLINQVRQVDIQEGTTRIELSPRGLGSIEVEMRTNSDGSLAIVVRAENDAVLSALREERDLLAAVIGNVDTGSLDFQEYSQEKSNEQSAASGASAGGAESDDTDVAADGSVTQVVDGTTLDLVT